MLPTDQQATLLVAAPLVAHYCGSQVFPAHRLMWYFEKGFSFPLQLSAATKTQLQMHSRNAWQTKNWLPGPKNVGIQPHLSLSTPSQFNPSSCLMFPPRRNGSRSKRTWKMEAASEKISWLNCAGDPIVNSGGAYVGVPTHHTGSPANNTRS